MKKLITALLALIMVFALTACGSSDALKGTWSCEDEVNGTVTWTFDGGGKCKMDNGFFNSSGKYTITDSTVSIKVDIWDEPIDYDFKVDKDNLKLTATNGLAPDYDLTRKK